MEGTRTGAGARRVLAAACPREAEGGVRVPKRISQAFRPCNGSIAICRQHPVRSRGAAAPNRVSVASHNTPRLTAHPIAKLRQPTHRATAVTERRGFRVCRSTGRGTVLPALLLHRLTHPVGSTPPETFPRKRPGTLSRTLVTVRVRGPEVACKARNARHSASPRQARTVGGEVVKA